MRGNQRPILEITNLISPTNIDDSASPFCSMLVAFVGGTRTEDGQRLTKRGLMKHTVGDNDAISKNVKQAIDLPKPKMSDRKPLKEKAAKFIVDAEGKMRFTGEIMKSFATDESELAAVLMDQIAGSLPFGKKDYTDVIGLNFASQAMHSLLPNDGLGALLCSQLVATHSLGMEFLKRAPLSEQSELGVDLNVNRATRLLRTFANLTEALRAHRNGGGQK